MTRFNITLKESVETVLWTIKNTFGGEIIIPKIPSYKILDLAKAIDAKANLKFTGLRPGEKIFEEMITKHDSFVTYDLGKYYAILNPSNVSLMSHYKNKKKVKAGMSYNSLDNDVFLTLSEIKKLIFEYTRIKKA